MRYALIENGVVVNVAEGDADWVASAPGTWIAAETAGPGWTYDGATFSEPVLTDAERAAKIELFPSEFLAGLWAAIVSANPPPDPAPSLDQIDTYVYDVINASALPDAQKAEAKFWLAKSVTFSRQDAHTPLLEMAAATLFGMSSADLDTLFIAAFEARTS